MKLGDGYGCQGVLGEGDSRVMGFIVDSHLTRRIQVVIGAEKILLNIAWCHKPSNFNEDVVLGWNFV